MGGGNLTGGSVFPTLCLLTPILLNLSAAFLPPLAAMASNLPRTRLHSPTDLVVLRRVLGWQASGYDNWLRCGVLLLTNLWSREFVFFSCYAVAGLVPPVSSFLLMLLEFYGVQLQHLSLHSFVLVVIFVHFRKMFISMWPSVPLFQLFQAVHWVRKGMNPIGTYYFQFRAKEPVAYIAAVSPSKWDRWREDWVIVRADPHDRLVLPTRAPTSNCDL
jgi:hypothetical protein